MGARGEAGKGVEGVRTEAVVVDCGLNACSYPSERLQE